MQNQPNVQNAIPEMQDDDVKTHEKTTTKTKTEEKKCKVFILNSSLLLVHMCALYACTRLYACT